MMILLYPTYTIEVTVQPPDETFMAGGAMSHGPFWDKIKGTFDPIKGEIFTGCDQVLAAVNEALAQAGMGEFVRARFKRYEERGRGG